MAPTSVKCAVAGCPNTGRRVKMFRFPKNEKRYEQWVLFCQNPDIGGKKRPHICANHFEKKFFKSMNRSLYLVRSTMPVPTLLTPSLPSTSAGGFSGSEDIMIKEKNGEGSGPEVISEELNSIDATKSPLLAPFSPQVEKDIINFEDYKAQKGPFKVCFRYGALPNRFDCFKNIKVRSVKDLKKKRIIVTEETKRLFLDPNYNSKGLDIVTDEGPIDQSGSEYENDKDIQSFSEKGFENQTKTEVDTTLHSLDEINQLLLDINNLGILSSVLSAYEKVYKSQKKWALQFSLTNAGSSFDCLIKKIADEADRRIDVPLTGNSKSFSKDKMVKRLDKQRHNSIEDSDHFKSSFADALINGGHNYTNLLPFNRGVENGGNARQVLPRDKVADVYQCEYCPYGSLYKYRLKHHIISRHRRRYTIFPKEERCESKSVEIQDEETRNSQYDGCSNFDLLKENEGLIEKCVESSEYLEPVIEISLPEESVENPGDLEPMKVLSEPKRISKINKARRKKLSYYLDTSRILEMKRLEKQIQQRKDWLEDFVKSFEQSKIAKPSTKKLTNVKRTYSCVLCDFTSSDQTEVYKHTGLSHIHGNGLHLECPCCEFKAVDKIALSDHLIASHYEDEFFKCKLCDYQTHSNDEYFNHICDFHATYTTLKCPHCKFTSSKQDILQKHIAFSHKVHPDLFPFKCDLCDFKAKMKQQYQTHYDSVHLKKKPYRCSFCSSRFAQRGHVVRHIQDIHLKQKPHLCGFCKYRTANRANLKAHLKAVHKVPDKDIPEVLKTCVNLRMQQSRHDDFEGIALYDTVDLLPDEDSEASQMIHDIAMEME